MFCVAAGFVFGEFVRSVRPVDYLTRPLLIAAYLALVVGLTASLTGRWAVVAAVFVTVWLVQPWTLAALAVAVAVCMLIGYRLWRQHVLNVDAPLLAAAVVFAAAGLVPIVPMMSWSAPTGDEFPVEGPPQYAILFDAYPRADTLTSYGLDISPFLTALEERGFTIYPDATSEHDNTFDTLTALLNGEGGNDSIPAQRDTRATWQLPDGWHVIAPTAGLATIPQAPTLNPGGFNPFEAKLMARTIVGPYVGDILMDGLRYELDRALDILASTDRRHVFAHIMAPHHPILYNADGTPYRSSCYAACPPEWELGATGGYIQWLNGRILEVVDAILERRPDAEIVLFSDHGGRFDPADQEEWHRVFLASRPALFEGHPHPDVVFDVLGDPAEPAEAESSDGVVFDS